MSILSKTEVVPDVGVWLSIREKAEEHVANSPVLASFLHATVLNHDRFEDAVSYHLAGKLANASLTAMQLREGGYFPKCLQ